MSKEGEQFKSCSPFFLPGLELALAGLTRKLKSKVFHSGCILSSLLERLIYQSENTPQDFKKFLI